MAINTSRRADVIVMGGGLIGCTIALRLAQAGLQVCVLERGELGAETSAAAAGMLAPQGETVTPDAFFELCAASRDLYPQFAAEIEDLTGQDVGYRRDGTLLVAIDDEECHELEAVHRAQAEIGLRLELLPPEAAHQRVPGLSAQIQRALFIPGDHWLDNEQLARAVVESCRSRGVVLCPGTSVTSIRARANRVESVEAVSGPGRAGQATFSADQFVLAAGCWSHALVEPLGIKLPMEPCRGQVMEFDASTEFPLVVRAGLHYLVPRPGRRVLIGTTAEYVGYDKGVTAEGLRSILEGVLRIAPSAKELRFRRAWAGLRPDTPDHRPILGRGEIENLLFATGHFRNGILLAPVTAQIISDLVLNSSTSYAIDIYSPTRFA